MKFEIVNSTSAIGPNTLGIEVVTPEMADRCDEGNIDPQHGQMRSPASHLGLCDALRASCAADGAVQWPLTFGHEEHEGITSTQRNDVTLATERADVDSVCAMAILALRAQWICLCGSDVCPRHEGHRLSEETLARVRLIADADNFVAGSRPWAPYPAPTEENLWPERGGSVTDTPALAALGAICSPRRGQKEHSLAFRVACAAAWLLGGDDPPHAAVEEAFYAVLADPATRALPPDHLGPNEAESMGAIRDVLRLSREALDAQRKEVVASIRDGSTSASLVRVNGEIYRTNALKRGKRTLAHHPWPGDADVLLATVESPCATLALGYGLAPAQVAISPRFRWPDGHETRKHTVAFWSPPGEARMQALVDELNSAEQSALLAAAEGHETYGNPDTGAEIRQHAPKARWGGNLKSGIVGSPMGRSSALSDEAIIKMVSRHVTAWRYIDTDRQEKAAFWRAMSEETQEFARSILAATA